MVLPAFSNQGRFPHVLHAPSRSVKAKRAASSSPASSFTVPDFKDRTATLLKFHGKRDQVTDQDKEALLDVFRGLKTIAKGLIRNDDFFNYAKFYLTDPKQLKAYDNLVSHHYTQMLQSGQKIVPGLTTRIDIIDQSKIPWFDFDHGEQKLKMKLNGFDLVFIETYGRKGDWITSLVPTFTVKDYDNSDENYLHIGLEMAQDNSLIFVDLAEAHRAQATFGVSFVRPDGSTRLELIWTNQHTINYTDN